jgi:7-cyano-7-deazaguanine synthase
MNPETESALVVLSGGQDSTTCLFWAKANFAKVHAVTFNYGQTHNRELEAATIIANRADIASHEIINLGSPLIGSSPLVNAGLKPEQYESWKKLPGGLEATFVPGRNALFLVVAANRAYNLGATTLVTGVAEEDFGGYPDCRETFIEQMEKALQLALSLSADEPMAHLQIATPLMHLSKAKTVELAVKLPGCMEALAYSHTAYGNEYPPVGNDHATLLRAKGFEQAGVPDPLVVRAWKEGLMPLPTTRNYDGLTTFK